MTSSSLLLAALGVEQETVHLLLGDAIVCCNNAVEAARVAGAAAAEITEEIMRNPPGDRLDMDVTREQALLRSKQKHAPASSA